MEKIDYLMKIPTRKYKYDSLDKVLEVIREDIDNFHNYRCEWGTRNQGKSLSSTKALLTKWRKIGIPRDQPYPRNYDNMVFKFLEYHHDADMEDYCVITGNKPIFNRWVNGDRLWPKDEIYKLEEEPDLYKFMRYSEKYGYNNYQINGFCADEDFKLCVNICHDFSERSPIAGYQRKQLKTLTIDECLDKYVNVSLVRRCLDKE